MRILFGLLAALAALAAMPAAAQLRQLAVTPGQPYEHPHSHLTLPPELYDLPLTRISDGSQDQLDVFANYEAGGEVITVYVYRHVSGALPVWFDRARNAVETRGQVYLGPVAVGGGAVAFAPPGQSAPSALAITYALGDGRFRSTGLALAPMGEWLVKVRYSSASLPADQLATRVRSVLAMLSWPDVPAAPAAVEVLPCTTPLVLKGKAKQVKADGAAALLSAMLGSPALLEKAGKVEEGPPATWCRDATPVRMGAVYRPDGAADTYLVALSDAGRGLLVQPDSASALLGEGKAKSAWSIRFVDVARTINFASHDRLPPPDQAIDIFEAGRALSATSTWGSEKKVEISPDALK